MSYWPPNQPPYPRYRLPNQPLYPGMFIAQPPPPAPAPPKPKRPWPLAAVNRWMGIGVVAITLLAVLLAVLAPLAANRPPNSTNLTVLYKSALRQNDGQWDENDTCHFTPDGYLVTAPNSRLAARCTLQTSNYQNFLLRIHIVAANQKASIGFLDGYWLEIQGTGRFQLAHVDGNLTTLLIPRGVVDIGAGSAALHPDSQGLSTRGNEITLLVQGTTITFYANGQMLGSYTASSVAGGPISLIAPQGQQALFSDLEIDQAP